MKEAAKVVLSHFDGIVAWAQTRQTNGSLEAINGLFQVAKRKARGYTRFKTMRTVLFLIASKRHLPKIGQKLALPTRNSKVPPSSQRKRPNVRPDTHPLLSRRIQFDINRLLPKQSVIL